MPHLVWVIIAALNKGVPLPFPKFYTNEFFLFLEELYTLFPLSRCVLISSSMEFCSVGRYILQDKTSPGFLPWNVVLSFLNPPALARPLLHLELHSTQSASYLQACLYLPAIHGTGPYFYQHLNKFCAKRIHEF